MRIGVVLGDLDSAVEEAVAAEAAGFDLVASGEHLFFHGPVPNSFVTLAAAAGATRTVRLVSSICLLPLYPAALVAKMALDLDRVSGGRFDLGVGAGGEFPPEFAAAGVDVDTRFRRLDEGLRVVRALFGGGPVAFRGEFADLDGVVARPGPVRPGGPPIWLGGRRAGAIRRAGRLADVWMPYMVEPERLRSTLAEVREHAETAGRNPAAVTGAVFLWTRVDADGDRARRLGTEVVSRSYQQDFTPLADRYLGLGDPAAVADRLLAYRDAGAAQVLLQPACAPEERAAVLELLATEVLPRVRRG